MADELNNFMMFPTPVNRLRGFAPLMPTVRPLGSMRYRPLQFTSFIPILLPFSAGTTTFVAGVAECPNICKGKAGYSVFLLAYCLLKRVMQLSFSGNNLQYCKQKMGWDVIMDSILGEENVMLSSWPTVLRKASCRTWIYQIIQIRGTALDKDPHQILNLNLTDVAHGKESSIEHKKHLRSLRLGDVLERWEIWRGILH